MTTTYAGRRTGRTYRTIEALPDGGTLVVHAEAMRPYVREQLRKQGRRSDAIRVVNWRSVCGPLRGATGPMAIDHAVYDCAMAGDYPRLDELLAVVGAANARCAELA